MFSDLHKYSPPWIYPYFVMLQPEMDLTMIIFHKSTQNCPSREREKNNNSELIQEKKTKKLKVEIKVA